MLDPKIATEHINISERQKPIGGCQKPLYNQSVIEPDWLGSPAAVYVNDFPVFSGAIICLVPLSKTPFGKSTGLKRVH
jgi:hypothetical protein